MTEEIKYTLPTWAPRLRKLQIARLYESSGRGLLDEELIDDVGFSLLARAESILAATEATRGHAPCPDCKVIVDHDHELLVCAQCGWKCPWDLYKKTIKYKKLHAGGLKPFLEEFVQKFTRSRSHSDKLILIDTLIHRYHWETATSGGRPGACGLIEGKESNIMPFLDGLNYGDKIPEDIDSTREEWRSKWNGRKPRSE